MQSTREIILEMVSCLIKWLESQNYNYIECNHVPEKLFTSNHKINSLIRAFFRLCPYNLRNMERLESGLYPLTPQSNVALLKAFLMREDRKVINLLYDRVLSLRSPKTKHFSLKQGIRISINLYENTPDDPSPLNTVWFGQFLLEENLGIIKDNEKQSLLFSIANYLIEELGYEDHQKEGIYFYYGPTLRKEIYNSSAVISAFLINLGLKYNESSFVDYGQRGILYIINRQNEDGSWFYAGKPQRSTIDNFHQSYILQSLSDIKAKVPFSITETINKGESYYRTMFIEDKGLIRPIRYDKRYTPRNTWLFQKIDGRDVAEGLIFFSKYSYDQEMIDSLIYYLYTELYNNKNGYFSPEILIFGKNKIPYIEFQAWFLYALQVTLHYFKD